MNKNQTSLIVKEIEEYNKLFFKEGVRLIKDEIFEAVKTIFDVEINNKNNFDGVYKTKIKTSHFSKIKPLKKIKEDDLNTLFKQNEVYFVEPKLDGIFINCIYINGSLKHMLTRGDLLSGDDLINKNFAILIPTVIDIKETVEIRGELIATKADSFSFTHSRNLVMSFVNKGFIPSSKEVFNKIKFFAFDILINKHPIFGIQKYKILEKQGFNLIEKHLVCCKTKIDVLKQFNFFLNIKQSLNFEIDGVVLSNINFYDKFALKFNDKKAESIIKDIFFQVGRTGLVVPIAKIQEIILFKSKIQYIPLYSLNYLKEKNITVGSKITILQMGDAVPVLTKVDNSKNFLNQKINFKCECGENILIVGKQGECSNNYCLNKNAKLITYIASRECLNIPYLNLKTSLHFVKYENITNVFLLLLLNKERILKNEIIVNKVKLKTLNKIIFFIENIKEIHIFRFLLCLNIRGVGKDFFKKCLLKDEFIFKNAIDIKNFVFSNFINMNEKQKESYSNFFDCQENLKWINKILFNIRIYFISNEK